MDWIAQQVFALVGAEPISLAPFVLLLALALALVEACLRIAQVRQPPAAAGAERHVSIDGLRGFLALGVLAHHYAHTYNLQLFGQWAAPPERFGTAYALAGQAGVAVFFMITGFLFWQRVLAQRGRLDWKRLAVSRVFRIVPLYVVVVGFVVLAVAIRTQGQLNEPPHRLAAQIGAWLLFQMPDINKLERTRWVIAGVAWTLQYEWLFYLSLPLWAWMLRQPGWGRPLLGGVAALAVALALWPTSIFGFRTQYFVFFAVGAGAAVAWRSDRLRGIAAGRSGAHVALAALIALFAWYDTAQGLGPLLLLTLAFVPIALGNDLYGLLRQRAAVHLGDLSYGIYLLHGLVLFYGFWLAFPQFLPTHGGQAAFWGGLAVTVLLVLVLSQLAFRFVESPFIEAGRRVQAGLDAPWRQRQAA